MSESEALLADDSRARLTMRVDNIYTLGRNYLSLPFAVFCMPAALIGGRHGALVLTPLLIQIIAVIMGENLRHAYHKHQPDRGPNYWARRYVYASAIAGASWGVSAIIWFVPNSFPAEAYLSLAFLGMTAAELIGRCAYRPAFFVHTFFSLTPLVVLLLLHGGLLATMTAAVIFFFAALLFGYCGAMEQLLDRSLRLKQDKIALIGRLSSQKETAEKARDAAEAGARAKSAFVANISHEIRTPLNALLGMAQLLDRAGLEKPQRDYVKVMLEAGRGLRILLDDVIALSNADSQMGAKEDCDPSQTARAVVQLLQPRAWEKQLRLTISVANGLPRASGDPRRVRQVLLKLTENALKFTDRGGVEIQVESVDADGASCVRFSVADTGLGIPSEVAAHLFEAFTPGDVSYTRRHAGAGLGLAVAKRIVDSLGGEIGFESEPGQGSTFWFTLPVASTSAFDRDQQAFQAQDAEPPADLMLLAYVTDRGVHRQLARYLEPFGNRIVFASTLAEAVARTGREKFDAIIARATDIESLASSPGARAPMLAILFPADKPPASGDEVLHWPAPANEVYAAIRKVMDRADGVAPKEQIKEVAAIDAPAFAALEKSLGFTTLIEILQSYIKTAENLCGALAAASAAEDWAEAARLAQDIAGAAGGLGLGAMTTAARGFAQQARIGEDSHALRNAAQMVVGEHVRVRNALTNLYPDLAA